MFFKCQPRINQPLGCSIGGDTIYVSYRDYLEGTPTINKPWFINPELTLFINLSDISLVTSRHDIASLTIIKHH